LHLQPRARAPALVRRIAPLRDDSFQLHPAGLGEEAGAVPGHVVAEAEALRRVDDEAAERFLPRVKRHLREVEAVEVEEAEDEVHEPSGRSAATSPSTRARSQGSAAASRATSGKAAVQSFPLRDVSVAAPPSFLQRMR